MHSFKRFSIQIHIDLHFKVVSNFRDCIKFRKLSIKRISFKRSMPQTFTFSSEIFSSKFTSICIIKLFCDRFFLTRNSFMRCKIASCTFFFSHSQNSFMRCKFHPSLTFFFLTLRLHDP